MPFHRYFLFPIMLAVFIGVVLWILSIPYFTILEQRVLLMIAGLIFFGSFILVLWSD